MKLNLKEVTALVLALSGLVGAVASLRENKVAAADQRNAWDNFGEYTVPEIEKLKARVADLEKSCPR